uniref:Protein kinase domain-containing protein n=1 Tax=Acrobeloides nanus TaxID=290746 RepID=A0A914CKU7_9BILA
MIVELEKTMIKNGMSDEIFTRLDKLKTELDEAKAEQSKEMQKKSQTIISTNQSQPNNEQYSSDEQVQARNVFTRKDCEQKVDAEVETPLPERNFDQVKSVPLQRVEGNIEKIHADMKEAKEHSKDMEKCCGLCILPWNKNFVFDNLEIHNKNDNLEYVKSSKDDGRGVISDQPRLEIALSPTNIMVNSKNQVKIVDMGIGNLTYKEQKSLSIFRDISTYLAPELLFNRSIKNRKDNPDLAADIWSIGCIFGELLIGKILCDIYDDVEILPMALPQEYLLWRKILQVLRISSLNDEEEVEICIRNNNESISINYDPLLWTDLFPDSIFQIFPLDSDNA